MGLLPARLYGKFAEQSEKQSLHVNPGAAFFEKNMERDMLMPGVWLAWEEVEVDHVHVPFAAHITALARRNLYRFMVQAKETYYCDTDGFACDLGSTFETSDSLGALKLEKVIREATFLAPKQYTMLTEQLDKDGKPKRITKGKGFSGITYRQFLQLEQGEEIEIERMARIRENLRAGRTEPIERLYPKRLRGTVRPKRRFHSNGSSYPWSVDELAEEWKVPAPTPRKPRKAR